MKKVWVNVVPVLCVAAVASGQVPESAQPATPQVATEPNPPAELGGVDGGAENNPTKGEMGVKLHDAVARGFDYLKSQQNIDGSVGDRGRGRYGRHVGITALCALAWMSDRIATAPVVSAV